MTSDEQPSNDTVEPDGHEPTRSGSIQINREILVSKMLPQSTWSHTKKPVNDNDLTRLIYNQVSDDIELTRHDISHALEVFRLMSPKSLSWYPEMMRDLHEAQTRLTETVRTLAISGVRRKAMTRRQAAQLLGVHENTIARWLHENDWKVEEILSDNDADQDAGFHLDD